jgi:hypothetical protein
MTVGYAIAMPRKRVSPLGGREFRKPSINRRKGEGLVAMPGTGRRKGLHLRRNDGEKIHGCGLGRSEAVRRSPKQAADIVVSAEHKVFGLPGE